MKKVFLISLVVCFNLNLQAQGTEKVIAPELVGKWCYINLISSSADIITNSCITLNSDGSFDATLDPATLPKSSDASGLPQSDYGKWWVNGNQLFYNSPANGQGSFTFQKVNHPRLENTPMIVINGISFATSSPRDPW